ncbi:MAG: hypothetical protein AAB601_01785, partial [Patescibacteria group bacterium]
MSPVGAVTNGIARWWAHPRTRLFWFSFLTLYFEFVVIRYLSSEIRVFAYSKNLPLIAAFLGIGIGMVLGSRERFFSRWLPGVALILFSLIAFAPYLNLTHLPLVGITELIFSNPNNGSSIGFLLVGMFCIPLLIIAFFIALGGFVGRSLEPLQPLPGYATNLLGSVAGVIVFAVLGFLGSPPWVWLLLGFGLLFLLLDSTVVRIMCVAIPLAVLFVSAPAVWSPYYRISLTTPPPLSEDAPPPVTYLSVNYDYHQKMLDLSRTFLEKYPTYEPNRSAALTYNLPFLAHPNPQNVLIVGAGTGNDVAAALRAGSDHIDAVEIDPAIYRLGKERHPERPYDDPRVQVHLTDARAFLKQTKNRYDTIVFAYLDSHTLVAQGSLLRLDDYVYTVESLMEAKNLLVPGGTLVLSFGGGDTFLSARLFATLETVFGNPPAAFLTNYDGMGVVFVAGSLTVSAVLRDIPHIEPALAQKAVNLPLATDNWPFFYMKRPTVSFVYLLPFLYLLPFFLPFLTKIRLVRSGRMPIFFLLGAGFLLLETRAVIKLSLLFGSTWIVTAIATVFFLSMALGANLIALKIPLK